MKLDYFFLGIFVATLVFREYFFNEWFFRLVTINIIIQWLFGIFFCPFLPRLSLYLAQTLLLFSLLFWESGFWLLSFIIGSFSLSFALLFSFLQITLIGATLFAFFFSLFRGIVLFFVRIALRIPFLRTLFFFLFSVFYFFWYYTLILFEKHLRTLLISTAELEQGGVPFSLVNAPDPSFSNFEGFNFPSQQQQQKPPHSSSSSSSSSFSLQNLHSLALIAKLSYEKTAIAEHVCTTKWKFSTFHSIKFKTTSAFVLSNEEVIVIAFRGTSPLNLGQIVTDVSVQLEEVQGVGKVHLGFLEAMFGHDLGGISHSIHSPPSPLETLQDLLPPSFLSGLLCSFLRFLGSLVDRFLSYSRWASGLGEAERKYTRTHSIDIDSCYDQVCRVVQKVNQDEKKPIFVTGHSLGGALATLFVAKALADDLFKLRDHQEKERQIRREGEEGRKSKKPLGPFGGLYTFGAPRVGNKDFSDCFRIVEEEVFRVVLRFDIVPHIPTTNMALMVQEMNLWLRSSLDSNLIISSSTKQKEEEEERYQRGEEGGGGEYIHPLGNFLFLSRGNLLQNPSLYQIGSSQLSEISGIFDWNLFQEMRKETFLRRVYRICLPFFVNDHLPCDYVNHISGFREKGVGREA